MGAGPDPRAFALFKIDVPRAGNHGASLQRAPARDEQKQADGSRLRNRARDS